jgi:Fic family protein
VQGVSAWEKWVHREDDLPLLIKIAMAHYQFETLHPFSDGNGRLGRLIIALQLVAAGAMTYPVLNVSPWLERRKDEYKDKLLAVSQTADFDPWIAFFCEAVRHQAEEGVARIEELLEFQQEIRQRLADIKARGVVNSIAESLLGYPVITISHAAELHNVTYPPASNAIETLVGLGVLRENTGQQYGRVYVCDRIRDILNRT